MDHRALTAALLLGCVCMSFPVVAQQSNPYEADPDAISAGSSLFANRCADCHGADAKGARGSDLTQIWAVGKSDAQVFESVRSGVDDSIMPPSFAPDNEIWAIVAYLRDISTVPPYENDNGNAALGRELFLSMCQRCHRVAREGGTLGPDLSRIAALRSREALVDSVRNPSASVLVGYRVVNLVTKQGERIEGVIKSEDAFSIQILDTDERLQGYVKADLVSLDYREESLMPQFRRAKVNRRELDDLLAYLGTLRPTAPEGP